MSIHQKVDRTTKNLFSTRENSCYLPNIGAATLNIRFATKADRAFSMGMKLTEWGLGFSEF
ncbi:hypothetical protein COV06_02045 [Candidatus Uhrbacteria bacterium CG10_big_fil_rev_8_21_14_0_10_50_16]|uniref:Uncharacterized protein n=1 Tax=Candidatus Uhrbacteria bacterium CG10_big_fil_rev_8_21_14_0_10_50_16 TaxID=1975039 RepID=A0A2H0RMM6_9BACT|nr:MAG: hypothetical protein COV06_02045 [Candidatus Uhrbacteria bacterium CG10_big_fil_rev_8_21_14_0_10_50_16]